MNSIYIIMSENDIYGYIESQRMFLQFIKTRDMVHKYKFKKISRSDISDVELNIMRKSIYYLHENDYPDVIIPHVPTFDFENLDSLYETLLMHVEGFKHLSSYLCDELEETDIKDIKILIDFISLIYFKFKIIHEDILLENFDSFNEYIKPEFFKLLL